MTAWQALVGNAGLEAGEQILIRALGAEHFSSPAGLAGRAGSRFDVVIDTIGGTALAVPTACSARPAAWSR
jgi:hypothetical protein